MLFNKKLLMGLSNLVAVILALTFLLYVTMYIWAFFAEPPLKSLAFNVQLGLDSYYILLNKLSTLVFFYVLLGGVAALVKSSKLPENFKK